MQVKFIIFTRHSFCRCFSDRDLEVNLRYALANHEHIVAVEAV